MKFSYEWLKDLVPGIPGPKEVAELLTIHSFEVESVVRAEGDWVLDIDILPNRMADASSHRGVARELAAVLTMSHPTGKPAELKLPDESFAQDAEPQTKDLVSVAIEDTDGCSFYAARVVRGVTVGESPDWLKKQLRVLGLESINNIVDVANYVMLEYGQPLHAFDLEKLSGGIVVRKAKKGETMDALDGNTYELDSEVAVIADAKGAIAIGGIKGGAGSGVGETTKDIALESAMFDPKRIYRSSRELGIRTDASRRFEAGRTTAATIPALNRAAQLISEIAGGAVAKGFALAGSGVMDSTVVPLDPARIRGLLGYDIGDAEALRALEAIGCEVQAENDTWTVGAPFDRTDLVIEEDLIEEIGRLVGYEAVRGMAPAAAIVPSQIPDVYRWADTARDILVRLGLREVKRYSFVSVGLMETWGMAEHPVRGLENPQSADFTHLRPSLLPNLLAMAESERKSRAAVRIFEVGDAFVPEGTGRLLEFLSLGMVFAEAPKESDVHIAEAHIAFFEAKGAVEQLLEQMGITDVAFRPLDFARGKPLNDSDQFLVPSSVEAWAAGRSAEVVVDGTRVGIVGELAPEVLSRHPALGNLAMAEFNFEKIAAAANEEHEYRAPSRYPEVMRDLALLVPFDVTADEVNQLIVVSGPDWLRDVDLFDYYEGDQIPDGMKSLAFRLAYQSDEKTLTDAEVNKAQEEIDAVLKQQGWEIR